MKKRYGARSLIAPAKDISIILRNRISEKTLCDDLNRFVNNYRIGLKDARRAVLVLHGIPSGLAGPLKRRFTYQTQLDSFFC